MLTQYFLLRQIEDLIRTFCPQIPRRSLEIDVEKRSNTSHFNLTSFFWLITLKTDAKSEDDLESRPSRFAKFA